VMLAPGDAGITNFFAINPVKIQNLKSIIAGGKKR